MNFSLRPSAYLGVLCVEIALLNAETAEIRRGPQSKNGKHLTAEQNLAHAHCLSEITGDSEFSLFKGDGGVQRSINHRYQIVG
jgi:hypothetical protein